MKNLFNNKVIASASLVSILMASTSAAAAHRSSNQFLDYAKVTNVEPVYETVVKSVPIEQCWNERVQTRHSASYNDRYSATPTLLGAIIGGAIGNELGHHKRNKQVGAVVGSLLGGSIGRDIAHNKQRRYRDTGNVEYTNVERCSVEHEQFEEQQLVGYEVTYRYRGNRYTTITDEEPNDKLRVRVNVTPVSF